VGKKKIKKLTFEVPDLFVIERPKRKRKLKRLKGGKK